MAVLALLLIQVNDDWDNYEERRKYEYRSGYHSSFFQKKKKNLLLIMPEIPVYLRVPESFLLCKKIDLKISHNVSWTAGFWRASAGRQLADLLHEDRHGVRGQISLHSELNASIWSSALRCIRKQVVL